MNDGIKLRLAVEGAEASAKAIDNVSKSLNDLSGKSEQSARAAQGWRGMAADFAHVGQSIQIAKAAFDGVTGSVTHVASGLIAAQQAAEKLRNSLEYSAGVAGLAGELDYLRTVTRNLGVDYQSAADGYSKFSAAIKGSGMTLAQTRDVFEGVAKATAKFGLSAGDAQGVFLALSQMASKGVVSAEEFRGQLAERLPPALEIAARAMGVTTAEFNKLLESGRLISSEFLPKFGQALKTDLVAPMNSLTQEINRLTGAWTQWQQALANADGSGFKWLTNGLNESAAAMRRLGSEAGIVQKLLVAIGGFEAGAIGAGKFDTAKVQQQAMEQLSTVVQGRRAMESRNLNYLEQEQLRELIRQEKALRDQLLELASQRGKETFKLPDLAGEVKAQQAKRKQAIGDYLKEVQSEKDKQIAVENERFTALTAVIGTSGKDYETALAAHITKITEINKKGSGSGSGSDKAFKDRIKDLKDMADAEQDIRKAAAAAEAKYAAERNRAMQGYLNDEQRQAAALTESTRRLQEEYETLGMSSEELARYRAEKLDTAAASEWLAAKQLDEAAAHLDTLQTLPDVAQKYRELAAAKREAAGQLSEQSFTGVQVAAKKAAIDAARDSAREWEKFSDDINRALTDALMRGFEDGKSFGQNFVDSLKNSLKSAALKIVVNMVTSTGGSLVNAGINVLAGTSGSNGGTGTNYLGLANNASSAYNLYNTSGLAYQYLSGSMSGANALGTGYANLTNTGIDGLLATNNAFGTAATETAGASAGSSAATAGLGYFAATAAAILAIKYFNDRSRPLPLEFTGLAVDGQYNGKTFDGSLATNYMQGGSYWDQRMQLTNDAAIVAQNYQNLKPPVIEIANPDYTTWQNAYQEAGFQNQIGDNAYRNGDETFYAPSKISGYDEGYTPAPYSTDPTVLGNIDAAIEATFNAPKSAMKKVAELFGDAELVTQIDAFTAKISVSGQTIGEILGKIGAQVTTDLGQAFLPAVEAARVQGAALRTGLETAIANATTAGDTEAVNTLKAQMEAIGIAASETWSQTFERVLKETDAVSKAMDLLGVSLKDIGDANKVLTLSDNLVTLFGGIDALNTSVNAYYGNFYTEAEKQERVWKNMGETFKSLNLAMPTTREGFRDLVEAQDLTTTAGQQTFVALMNVQGAFADLTPAMNAAATAAEALAVTAEQLGSAKSALMGYFTTAQRRSVLTGNIYDTALENGVDLGGESLTNLSNASRQDFAAYVQSVANEGTEASRRMLVALAAIAPVFEDLVALAEAAAAADLQAAIDKTQSAIDALTGQYGDVATAMLEINPPAKTLVESWRDNKTALEALQGTFDQFFGVTIPDAAATIQSLLTQLSAFEGGAETARSNADNARLQGMTPTERAAFWRNQEATLWQGLGNSTDKAGTISKIMGAYANTRAAELDALTGEQTKLNDAQKTGIQDQIDAWKTTLSVIEQSKRLVEDIDKTLAGLAYSDLSNLGYTDQLGAASSSYSNTLSKAAAGDTNAMGNLTSIARDYLTEAQTYFGGATLDYSNVYDKVTGDLRGLGMGLNTDGTGAQSEINRLTAAISGISTLPADISTAFSNETADGYIRIANALTPGADYTRNQMNEQKRLLEQQIVLLQAMIDGQQAQIAQQEGNLTLMLTEQRSQTARLTTLESNTTLAGAGA